MQLFTDKDFSELALINYLSRAERDKQLGVSKEDSIRQAADDAWKMIELSQRLSPTEQPPTPEKPRERLKVGDRAWVIVGLAGWSVLETKGMPRIEEIEIVKLRDVEYHSKYVDREIYSDFHEEEIYRSKEAAKIERDRLEAQIRGR